MESTAAGQTVAVEKRCKPLGAIVTATTTEYEAEDEDLETDDTGTTPAGPTKIRSLQ